MPRTSIRHLVAATTASALALTLLGPAGAARAAHDRENFSGTEEFVWEDCGFPIEVERSFHGVFIGRETRTGWQRDQFAVHDVAVYSNPANGAWFTLRADTNFRETSIVDLGDDLLGVTARQSGAAFTLTDSSGRVVVRDVGVLVLYAVFDVSSGEPQFVSQEVVADRGRHPGYYLDLCQAATELIG